MNHRCEKREAQQTVNVRPPATESRADFFSFNVPPIGEAAMFQYWNINPGTHRMDHSGSQLRPRRSSRRLIGAAIAPLQKSKCLLGIAPFTFMTLPSVYVALNFVPSLLALVILSRSTKYIILNALHQDSSLPLNSFFCLLRYSP